MGVIRIYRMDFNISVLFSPLVYFMKELVSQGFLINYMVLITLDLWFDLGN